MTSDLDRVLNNLNRLAADLEKKTPEQMVTASARTYTNSIRDEIARVTTGNKLRGVGSKTSRAAGGARVGVKYEVKQATAIVQGTGPLHLLERDTRDHMIPSTSGSKRARTAAGRLSHKRQATGRSASANRTQIFLGNRSRNFAATGPVHHPGTRGKHPFERGVKAVERQAVLDAVQQFSRELGTIYKAAT
jgi:hypothetical protein